jgi:polyferredoxin
VPERAIVREKGQESEQRGTPASARQKKAFARRPGRDYSQAVRCCVQVLFVLLNLWIGVEFYLFVRHYETAGQTPFQPRPAGVEGWLPIASLMNLKYLLFTGSFPPVHPAGLVLFLAFIGISLLWSKSFCSWLCPVGTLSEALWKLGKKIFRRNLVLPRWLDWPLRSLKYVLLGLFFLAVGSMPVRALEAFLQSPYGLIADVKMLNFFRQLSLTSILVLGVLALASLFIQNFWCRYLCPYGAFLSIPAWLSRGKIRRNSESCIDCAKCAKACPSLLPVDKLKVVRSVECTSCLECVAVCPVQDTLQMSLPGRKAVPEWVVAAGIVVLFLGIVGIAKWTGHWDSSVPDLLYFQLIPQAHLFQHP